MTGKRITIAFLEQQELWQTFYSYCMVSAIWETLRVENDDSGFLHFVSQNFLAPISGGKPVSAEVGSPVQLRARRDEIFFRKCAPWLSSAFHLAPRTFAAYVHQIELEKAEMLIDIRARFERVQVANERIRENLDTSKKAMIVLERGGACAIVSLAAGAVLVGLAASTAAASTVALVAEAGGTVVAGQATAALAAVGTAGTASNVAIIFALAHGAVKMKREIGSVEEPHAWAWSGAKTLTVQGMTKATEEYGRMHHILHLVKEVETLGGYVDRALLSNSKRVLSSPQFVKVAQKYMERASQVGDQALKRGLVAKAGVVVCAGWEIWDEISEGMEDWEK